EIDAVVMSAIEKELASDKRPFYQAANYYFENGKDLNKALEWVNEAVKNRPDAFWMYHLKAKIQISLKDYNGAIASAEKSKSIAQEINYEEYVQNNNKLIAEIKAK